MQNNEPAGGTADAQIEISGLTKVFHRRSGGGSVTPVDDISLSVADGEMLVLLGPSGCGKTTLLRCVAGLERPDAGSIRIQSETVWDASRRLFVPPNRRSISMIFQSYALWPHMTVAANVAYPLKARGLARAKVADAVSAALERVGLGGLGRQFPGQLSGGQQQRVALARAVVADARVILFDEPLSNVDAKVREELRTELARMQRDLGFTGIYVTHDQVEAMELADRIAVLDRGRIEQLATPSQVYRRPRSRYVADFVGAANVIPASVRSVDGDSLTLDTSFGTLEAAGPEADWAGGRIEAGTRVYAMARPEDCEMVVEGGPGAGGWRARVDLVTFSGTHLQYVLRVGEQSVRVWSSRPLAVDEGADVWLSIPPANVHILPAMHSISHGEADEREDLDPAA